MLFVNFILPNNIRIQSYATYSYEMGLGKHNI
jgi:hypothetical protein